ncbi:MAG: UDP-2,3-diacylglucosamine diphosphatase LpxI [Alphaproteobacteria bacterium]|nr:UDP-2,3-diacylglucosamine diphosphatase LpxI [Alphaproteobacteria bacterium]
MLALIAGTGDLPPAVLQALPTRPLICALAGFAPKVPPDITFRIERLGGFLRDLRTRGVTQICMVGAIRRPPVRLQSLDLATLTLVPTIWRALRRGDDGALRAFIAVLERRGFTVLGAHEVAPALLPPVGVLTQAQPQDRHRIDAVVGEGHLVGMGAVDLGQACIVRDGHVVDAEDDSGTDALLLRHETLQDDRIAASDCTGGILFKGPKPQQDRRADLPVVGVGTVMNAAAAGLAGLVIEADGVMVPDRAGVIETLDALGMFLWVRPKGAI